MRRRRRRRRRLGRRVPVEYKAWRRAVALLNSGVKVGVRLRVRVKGLG